MHSKFAQFPKQLYLNASHEQCEVIQIVVLANEVSKRSSDDIALDHGFNAFPPGSATGPDALRGGNYEAQPVDLETGN